MDERELLEILRGVTAATITTLLLKKGLRNVWMRGPRPQRRGSRASSGPLSLCASSRRARIWRRRTHGPRRARPAPRSRRCLPDVWLSRSALGITDAGIFGDILCARMVRRGVAGLITDGVVRDIAGVRSTGLPIWSQGVAAPPSVAGLIFEGWQQPVGCGGVAVFPGDLIVADDDGAVVVPAGLALEQERFEAWAMSEVQRGAKLPGLYPPDAETRARYDASKT